MALEGVAAVVLPAALGAGNLQPVAAWRALTLEGFAAAAAL